MTEQLQAALDAIHLAGVPGVFAEVRAGDRVWRGASGVADVDTGRPVTPDMRHRVGSITKTFTAAAVLRQVEQGRVGLDEPIGRYLPHLVPGERGDTVTVRMLLNHTSGFAEYLPARSRRSPVTRRRATSRPAASTTTGTGGSARRNWSAWGSPRPPPPAGTRTPTTCSSACCSNT